MGDARCFMCDERCDKMHSVRNPRSDALLSSLGCSAGCDRILVLSSGGAAVWQNKRTGLFTFLGEHKGKPVYQNNATKEFLFYTDTGSEWLVGPDFRQPHAGIQMHGNADKTCPEKAGGGNATKLYIDSSEPSMGGAGKWTNDSTLTFQCYDPSYKAVRCDCNKYKIFNLAYTNGTEAPEAVKYLSGTFTKINAAEFGLMAPLYRDEIKGLYLFSHHPKGRVWQVSTKLSTTPLRSVFDSDDSCPDSKLAGGDYSVWEWFNKTTKEGQQLYVKDRHIHIKCLDNFS